jgi:predicted N-formylglutamate amidohydrolase
MSRASVIAPPGGAVPPPADARLLGPDEPPSLRLFHAEGRARVLLICDHASNRIPARLGTLGLAPADLQRHIAWDIGAARVTEHLARHLDAPALLTRYSRLVADVNRTPDCGTLMVAESDGIAIPGNRDLTQEQQATRHAEIYRAYHDGVATSVQAMLDREVRPVLISVHSFTPVWKGERRPWQLGVLWNQDGRLALPLLAALRREPDLVVGDNEPYSARTGPNQTLDAHAEANGLASAAIEIRQDLIEEETGAAAWAQRLAGVLRPLLADPALYMPR